MLAVLSAGSARSTRRREKLRQPSYERFLVEAQRVAIAIREGGQAVVLNQVGEVAEGADAGFALLRGPLLVPSGGGRAANRLTLRQLASWQVTSGTPK